MSADANPYVGAYPFIPGRREVWDEIVRYVRRDVPDARSVLELGAGYCDFINQFPASRKIAFDLNPEMQRFADPDVELHIGDCAGLPGVEDGCIDVVFASNFLEHFERAALSDLLGHIHRVLSPGGRLLLLQPNYTRCYKHYFDDPTHVSIFSDRNMAAWLAPHGLQVEKLDPGLLPFSMNSRLPKNRFLTRAYLSIPFHRPMSAQMYVVARKVRL